MNLAAANIASLALANWFIDNWGWLAAAAFVLIGLFVVGFSDVRRFSIKRAWAISSVCFDESIRRRVLWLTPLAVLGVLVITQLQRGFDEQDVVRQTIKTCLFATGVVVILSSIILACTNLPKEIESRVIFTIVTKPTTRLELILGKIIGFARVSLAILIIMGIFTWAYLRVRSHVQSNEITTRLQEGELAGAERDRLMHYQENGLLSARSVVSPMELAMFAREPQPNSDIKVIGGDATEHVNVPFPIDRNVMFGQKPAGGTNEDWAHQGAGDTGLIIEVELNTHRTGPANDQEPIGVPQPPRGMIGPTFTPQPKKTGALLNPVVDIQIFDDQGYSMIAPTQTVGATDLADLVGQIGTYLKTFRMSSNSLPVVRLSDPEPTEDGSTAQKAYCWVPPMVAQSSFFNRGLFEVSVSGYSANTDYLVGPTVARVFVPQMVDGRLALVGPEATEIKPLTTSDGKEVEMFRGNRGIHGDQELKGGPVAGSPVAMYSFRGDQPSPIDGKIPFEIMAQIEREDADVIEGHDDTTRLDISVVDGATGKTTRAKVNIETGEPGFFTVPASAITGPNFDVLVRCENKGHLVQLYDDSVKLVTARHSFESNLLKSLAIIWMMSILVVAIAVMCSTFLSWPIAIVLTIVLLLGHWGVSELADAAAPGLGRQIVNDAGFRDPAMSNVVSTSVDALSRTLQYVARGLPDTSQFDAISDIEQGVTVSHDNLVASLLVLFGFGLPAVVAAYLILLNREVAP